MEINYHNKVDGTKVFHVTLTSDADRKLSSYMLKKKIIQWIVSGDHKHDRDVLNIRKLYQRPHLQATLINRRKYLFVLYNRVTPNSN